jgi:hypothetical protein
MSNIMSTLENSKIGACTQNGNGSHLYDTGSITYSNEFFILVFNLTITMLLSDCQQLSTNKLFARK